MPQSQHRSRSRAACVEECDENENVIPGTERYATSQPPSPREKPNTSKSRKGDKRGRSPRRHVESDDDSQDEHISPTSYRMKLSEKEKGPAAYKKAHPRPPPRSNKTMPVLHNGRPDESEYYGVRAAPGGPPPHHDERRPRAHTAAARPPSFHDHSRPPPANAAYFNQQRYPPPHGPGPIPTSFPPPTWHQGLVGGPPPGYPPPLDPGPPPQALPAPPPRTPMSARGEHPSPFGPPPRGLPRGRPMSAMGHHRPSPSLDFEDTFEMEGPPHVPFMNRRPSNTRRGDRAALDRLVMPPPPPQRPQSVRPNQLVYRTPLDAPASRSRDARKSVNFGAGDGDYDESFFPEADYISPAEARRDFGIQIPRESPRRESPFTQMSFPHRPAPRGRRPSVSTVDRSVSYEQGNYRTEVARPAARRHSTMYGYGPSGGGASLDAGSEYDSDDDDGMDAQIRQMEAHTGVRRRDSRLTESALRKAAPHPPGHLQRRGGGSSRSTRSSDSWDGESEGYRESATTRTTHSGPDEQESVTIKIKNAKAARVGGVDIEINGGEIEIQRGSGVSETRSFRGDTGSVYNGSTTRSRYPERPALPAAPRRADSFSSRRPMTVGPGMPGLPMPPTPQSRAPVPYGYNFDDPYAAGIAAGALPPPTNWGGGY